MNNERRRVNVNFSESAYNVLEGLARDKGKSISAILRDAIALEKWFDDIQRDGGRLILERANGMRQEVIPR